MVNRSNLLYIKRPLNRMNTVIETSANSRSSFLILNIVFIFVKSLFHYSRQPVSCLQAADNVFSHNR